MNTSALFSYKKPLLIAVAIAFAMLLTRGSHVLTQVSLPDASLALFLLGGLLLKRWAWFAAFFGLATVRGQVGLAISLHSGRPE